MYYDIEPTEEETRSIIVVVDWSGMTLNAFRKWARGMRGSIIFKVKKFNPEIIGGEIVGLFE